MTVKLKAPEGFTDVSFGGQSYTVGEDRIVEVPAEAAQFCISSALAMWLKSLPKLKKKVSTAVKKTIRNRKKRPLILKRLNNDDRPCPT